MKYDENDLLFSEQIPIYTFSDMQVRRLTFETSRICPPLSSSAKLFPRQRVQSHLSLLNLLIIVTILSGKYFIQDFPIRNIRPIRHAPDPRNHRTTPAFRYNQVKTSI